MKKVLLLCFLMLLAVNSFAGDWFLSYQLNRMDWEDDGIKETIDLLHLVETGYSFNDYFEIGIEGGFVDVHTDKYNSSFKDFSLLGTFKLKYPLTEKFSIYGVTGIGERWFTDKKIAQRTFCWGKYPLETMPNYKSLAFKYGFGMQYKITKNIVLFGEGVYRYADTGKEDRNTHVQTNIDVYAWSYGGGIKIYF